MESIQVLPFIPPLEMYNIHSWRRKAIWFIKLSLFNSQIVQLKLPSTQDIQLTSEHLKGEKEVLLKFVKFQDIQNIQLFVKDNQV